MIKSFRDAKIFYRFFDRKSEVVNVYLHGWGCDHKSFLFCHKHNSQSSLFIDFPPFGESSKDIKDWTVFTYANMVMNLCNHLKIKKINLIGHSFGGRISIILAVLCKNEVNKVVLVDSAGLKPRRSLGYYFKIWAYKIRKMLGLDTSTFGSCDYLALSKGMKKIFNSIVTTHLDDFLPFIQAETLIVFGKNDKTTPLYMAKKMKRKIKASKLVVLENAGHFCYVDRRLEFLSVLRDFLKE
ncbi:MAG: alpha/beta hydrolase [Clostridia bacterium]|nr:alpha/beta hydrolase [Clostridia bacterium]